MPVLSNRLFHQVSKSSMQMWAWRSFCSVALQVLQALKKNDKKLIINNLNIEKNITEKILSAVFHASLLPDIPFSKR
ncbi:hypothetical protein [Mucilaginibacter gotjawali]|uniref:Uncharacterized protein n=1 Tax=Mucilaginibacter gotjawali TaxID=1550579 RepID=A0A839SGH2_9SPHI|nr:hypothetical protein [Mucilaginibacter gotjawali]MBB3056403.1 hypothetical protein [Mucilaginibacter gotjawali]